MAPTKSAVRVVIRTRPTTEFPEDVIKINADRIDITMGKRDPRDAVNNQVDSYSFKYDAVLYNTSQEGVFEDIAQPVVDGLIKGVNGTIMAYGQTGAGKTFTMSGSGRHYKYRGIVPRMISSIFHELNNRPEVAATVKLSYLEIYNETLFDLLDDSAEGLQKPLDFLTDKDGDVRVRGLTEKLAHTEEEAHAIFFEGETSRSVAVHQLNERSSRSHCIITIHVEQRSRVESTGKVISSKVRLVDLAGSERTKKSMVEGVTLREANYINKSLSFLEQVVLGLSSSSKSHVPFRQSKLTNVLKDSLGGNCRTVLIANIWPEERFIEQTVSTLRFATRMTKVTTEYTPNIRDDPEMLVKKLQNQVADLKKELSMRDALAGQNQASSNIDGYSEQQQFLISQDVKSYFDGEKEMLEIQGYLHMKEVLRQAKILYTNLKMQAGDPRPLHSSASGGADAAGDTGDGDGEDAGVGTIDPFSKGSGFAVGAAPDQAKPTKYAWDDAKESAALTARRDGTLQNPPDTAVSRDATGYVDVASGRKQTESRTAAFERYKLEEGSDISNQVKKLQVSQKKLRMDSKELAAKINTVKHEIDHLNQNLDEKRQLRHETEENDQQGQVVIDAEEYEFIRRLKECKREYKSHYAELAKIRNELDYTEKLVMKLKHELLQSFDGWYESNKVQETMSQMSDGDAMDDGERFEIMQQERILAQDPDSYPFEQAKKRTVKIKRRSAAPKR
eukprot:Rmarinus@m.26585